MVPNMTLTLCQKISFDINQASSTLDQVNAMIKCYREGQVLHADVTPDELDYVEDTIRRLSLLYKKWCTIFNWEDGPLVQAMKNGDLFLVDEISLADDSVLERLNSVLEPERKLVGFLLFFLLKTIYFYFLNKVLYTVR